MNPPRLAVAATVLVMLCGTAGAETMDKTKNDPLAAPVSAQSQTGERAAQPWTPERQAKAEPKPTPDVDPAAVADASAHFRSGNDGGPEGGTAPVVLAAEDAPIGVQSAPAGQRAGRYWTGERQALAQAKPTPVVDPAAVAAASGHVRSGNEGGPEGGTAPVVLAAEDAPIGAQSNPGGDGGADYWTPERMRKAMPMPMPELPEGSPIKPGGAKNR